MLELILQVEPADRERMPVSAEMIDSLRETIADGVDGGYDIDAVLFHLALAVVQLESTIVRRQAQLLDLETRILNAGLRLRPPD